MPEQAPAPALFGYAEGVPPGSPPGEPRSPVTENAGAWIVTIVCVTPNPAIDRTLVVPGFAVAPVAGRVFRAARVHAAAGGKGLNVARALLRLGRPALCAGPLGGATGRLVADRAAAEGIEGRWTWIAGETRTCVIILGTVDGCEGGEDRAATVINEPGPVLSAHDWARFSSDVAAAAGTSDAVCISGSFPPARAPGEVAQLIAAAARACRGPLWVDTSGAALAEAVSAVPAGIKINGDEAGALLGRTVGTADDALRAARDICAQGLAGICVTLGANGAVLCTADGAWHATPPPIDAVNAVGSGDCFLAGLVAGLVGAMRPADALRRAVACGTANALGEHASDIEERQVQTLAAGTTVNKVL